MEIITKYNVGEKFYVLIDGRIIQKKVHSFRVDISCKGDIQIDYYTTDTRCISEDRAYASPEALCRYLVDNVKMLQED